MKYIKYIKKQDSNWKQCPCFSGETSINLSNEISEYLTFDLVSKGEETTVTFFIYKVDFISALDFIQTQTPLFRTTSQAYEKVIQTSPIFNTLRDKLNNFFGSNDVVEYSVVLYHRRDGRTYLKGLRQKGFSLRDYLLENSTALVFSDVDGLFQLHIESAVTKDID